ncbi:Extracellular solute-binding protein, family 7 [Thermovirga lienii DSM 17291]|uniref:Extracellular solute-binding protein, family 7 n=1 Tax=Thermovirga lienii (strain ATCC BAA-1197 / DSM 17291 / Cas60314) TaxID=580340 RepID=G7V7P7_THELD|nr:TRAP transporter substrate-binding protein DctP [Thermovirga lienii]AER67301.1 Extracellular solute-binding protein, family 7 [Thermovirga lienii DSM 17291]
MSKGKMYLSLVVGFVVVFTLMAGAAFAAPEITLKFAGQSPSDHPATMLMNEIAKEVAEKSNGRIEIKVYPASQLGDYELVYEEMIRGTIDMSCTSVPSQFDPRLELVYINGFVKGYDDVKRIFAPNTWLFNKMDELNQRLGVKLLGFFIEGMIGTGTVKPANEPLNPNVDKGVLIRVPNMDVYKLAAEAMGYRTVTIPWSDVYQSLQTGVCEGVNGFSVAAAYTMLRDVLKHWYMTNYSLECLNYMVSMKTWAKLSPEDQKIIAEAVAHASAKSIEEAKANDEKYMQLMRDQGIEVHTYSPEELVPIAKACASTWPKLKDKMTPELIDEFIKELAPKD